MAGAAALLQLISIGLHSRCANGLTCLDSRATPIEVHAA
jgi:hypothetical protein